MCAALLENKLVASQDSEEHAAIEGFSARVSSRIPLWAKRKEEKNDEKDEKDEQILGSSRRDAPAVSMLD